MTQNAAGRLVNAIAPPAMGGRFRWLLASSWTTNLADGVALAAGPLLIESQTDNATLIAAAVVLQRLPWLIFGMFAGVTADRHDRRSLIVNGNIARVAVLAALAGVIAAGQINVALVLVALFLVGVAEVFVDTTTDTLLPMFVSQEQLGVGNARMIFGRRAINQLAGPPIGAFLFALGAAVPFVTQGLLIVFGIVLISRVGPAPPATVTKRTAMRSEMMAGVRFIWNTRPLRSLAITVLTLNVTFGALGSVLVVYAVERLDTGEIGFGLLLGASALGGLVGAVAYGSLERRFSPATLMRTGLLIEAFTHLWLALLTIPALAMLVMAVFGVHDAVWGSISNTIRHRAVPEELQGRVGSVYRVGLFAGMILGGVAGGIITEAAGVVTTYLVSFAGSLITVVALWGELGHIVHDAEPSSHSDSDKKR